MVRGSAQSTFEMTATKTKTPKVLVGRDKLLLRLIVLFVGLWSRTLRYRCSPQVQLFMDRPFPPSVVVVWHNRLFVAPEFFRRYFKTRKLATLISASADGGWLAGFFQILGMRPVRGSRHGRGAQAFREMLNAYAEGYDLSVTPDGSRGPIYRMKPGAAAAALKTGAPILLLSFNFTRAWRLKSWDRFFLPWPFSRVDVEVDAVGTAADLGVDTPQALTAILQQRLDAITKDATT
ncbi:MAG: lysophospholipid acyltransferase (LPLAT)-like uncharacterized protein [Lentimonas sp.]|jgi:lysophospholipid acyltransferase (LPLAT)-like uncharacterized protein